MGLLTDILRSVEFLSSVPTDELQKFMVAGRCSVRPRRHVFWRAGDESRELVVTVSGEAMTATRSPDGREIIHEFAGPGRCIGLSGVLDGLPRPIEARVARAGEFFAIQRDEIWAFLDRNPRARRAAVTMLGRMYRRGIRDHQDVVFHQGAERVARFFAERACVRQTNGARVLVAATVAELASRTGMVPEVASRLLARLRRAGLVRRQRKSVFITDWAGLRALAGWNEDEREAQHEAALGRTERYFLPMVHEGRGGALEDEARKCIAVLGDLALCRERGCPAALASPFDAERSEVRGATGQAR